MCDDENPNLLGVVGGGWCGGQKTFFLTDLLHRKTLFLAVTYTLQTQMGAPRILYEIVSLWVR
jgi:hypothetical protein